MGSAGAIGMMRKRDLLPELELQKSVYLKQRKWSEFNEKCAKIDKRAGGGSILMTSRSNERSAIELPVSENIGVAVGISLLSCLEGEM